MSVKVVYTSVPPIEIDREGFRKLGVEFRFREQVEGLEITTGDPMAAQMNAGAPADDDSRPGTERLHLIGPVPLPRLVDGTEVEVATAWSLYQVHLKDYDLDSVSEITSAPRAFQCLPVTRARGTSIPNWGL